MPIPLAARSKAWVCGRSLAGIVGSNPTVGINVCFIVCCQVGLITRPEEAYRLWCVVVCDHESSTVMRPCPTGAVAPWGGV